MKIIAKIVIQVLTVNHHLRKHQKNIKENLGKKFKCKSCGEINGESQCLECKSKFRRSKQISKHTNLDQQLKVASLNICRGLFSKEELLQSTIKENNFDVCSVSEVDIENFEIKNPFNIKVTFLTTTVVVIIYLDF